MSKNVNVLSLFNGMSCGMLALERGGFNVLQYYSAEIDKYANKVTEDNYRGIVQLGDVTKWREWDIEWDSIDLILGGFPCQAWSMAGKQLGDRDERGMLFWTMLDIMKHVRSLNPDADFLIENVKMKKEFEEYITDNMTEVLSMFEATGNEPREYLDSIYENASKTPLYKILINSALVSAQNRNRYYWTSFPVTQPEDKGIVLADIVESEGVGVIKNHGEWKDRFDKSMCIDANYHKGPDNHGQRTMIKSKSRTVRSGGHNSPPDSRHNWDNVLDSKTEYRKLTPVECERLQTVPDGYTASVSNTQRYKMLGNGWTVDVITHILKHMR
ncbi:DNA (cytosine-5-)-methyltransferase [Vibrio phage 103E44.1]|nr:DNA (cytosine-5-)-methyltransferase [Vibrio phage 103E44.1]QZI87889.1 DNA (cytosine-5-)-methyltransferase [Vibrio phage 104E43.1]